MEKTGNQFRKLTNWLKSRPRLEIEESATWFLLLFIYIQGLTTNDLGFGWLGPIPQVTAPQVHLGMALLCLVVSVVILIEPLLPCNIRRLTKGFRVSPIGRLIRGISVFFAFILGMTAGITLLADKVPTFPWLIFSVICLGFVIFVVMEIKLIWFASNPEQDNSSKAPQDQKN